ncbi:MAG: hypothetical protein R6X02_20015 [Enhygromyxa sp.]
MRMSRGGASASRRREYLTALRRETAKYGRSPDLVEFDCLLLCMSCGHLSEPAGGDPMRSEPQAGQRRCGMCGARGLVDLRHTPMVQSLCALEATDVNVSRLRWGAKLVVTLGFAGALALLLASIVGPGLLGGALGLFEASFLLVLVCMVGIVVLTRMTSALRGGWRRRRLPRRWRMPRSATSPGAAPHRRVRGEVESSAELLRAPLSGRPCVAYEVTVGDDADPGSSLASMRLLEQDNVGFAVGEVEVAAGEARLEMRRELFGSGTIGSLDEATRRYMRMRGLLDTEEVSIHETILAPGDECAVSRRSADAPVLVGG